MSDKNTTQAPARPARIEYPPGRLDAFPERLLREAVWLCFRFEFKAGKWAKVPYYASGARRSGRLDSLEDRAKLVPLEHALAAYERGRFDGLGIALGPISTEQGAPHVQGVDFDAVMHEGCALAPWLERFVLQAASYTECSPSARGLHILGLGELFRSIGSSAIPTKSAGLDVKGEKRPAFEAYAGGRFFTVTGNARMHPGALANLAPLVERFKKALERSRAESPAHSDSRAAAGGIAYGDADQARVRSALFYLKDYDAAEPEWMERLWQVHHGAGGAQWGLELFCKWSAQSERYASSGELHDEPRRKIKEAWKRARPDGGVTVASLFWDARLAGWQDTGAGLRHIEGGKRADGWAAVAELDMADASAWGEPVPFPGAQDMRPYPVQSLPEGLRAAVEEVARVAGVAPAMAASCALPILAMAAQRLTDVERPIAHGRTAVSVYSLIVAPIGSRKSTVERMLARELHSFDAEKAQERKSEQKKHKAAELAWNAELAAIKDSLRPLKSARIKPEQLAAIKEQLAKHHEMTPEPPRVPRLLFQTATPQAMVSSMAVNGQKVGFLTSEASIVFGGHAMKEENRKQSAALWCALFDGTGFSEDTISRGSARLSAPRLSMGLQIQPETFRQLMEEAGETLRGSGLLSRFIMCAPKDLAGSRLVELPVEGAEGERAQISATETPAVDSFNARMRELLHDQAARDQEEELALLSFDAPAARAYLEVFNEIERAQAGGSEYAGIRDHAGRCLEIAARIAALFHIWQEGAHGLIGEDALRRAIEVSCWHLDQARALADGELGDPESLRDARTLEAMLLDYCRENGTTMVPKNTVLQYGPARLRRKEARDVAIKTLAERDRVRPSTAPALSGQRGPLLKVLWLNPRLLGLGTRP